MPQQITLVKAFVFERDTEQEQDLKRMSGKMATRKFQAWKALNTKRQTRWFIVYDMPLKPAQARRDALLREIMKDFFESM